MFARHKKGATAIVILNIHEDMWVITSTQGGGCCEQEPTQKHKHRLLFIQLKFIVSIRKW